MISPTSARRRVLRREVHSPRSASAIVLAVLAGLALVWLALECVLAAIGQHALLLSPAQMATGVLAVPTVPFAALLASGIVLVLIGLGIVVTGVTPGRRGRHVLPDAAPAVVVDDEVIASALADTASRTASVDPDDVVASVGRSRVVVRITPQSGVPIDRADVQSAVAARLDSFGLRPRLTARVSLSQRSKVGA